MSLVIRLQRTGRENTPTYRLVLAEKRAAAKGKFQEILGHYLPARTPSVFEPRTDRIAEWIKKGAIPSDTVARLLKHHGMKDMDRYIQRYAKRKPRKAPAAEAAPAAA